MTEVVRRMKKGQRLTAAPEIVARVEMLQLHDVCCLVALGPLGDVEGDPLSLVEGLETVSLDCAIMNENVVPIVASYEAVTLCCVEPLNRTLSCQICSS